MKQAFVDQIRGNDPLIEKPKNIMQGTVAGFLSMQDKAWTVRHIGKLS